VLAGSHRKLLLYDSGVLTFRRIAVHLVKDKPFCFLWIEHSDSFPAREPKLLAALFNSPWPSAEKK
jgi:hypothetical protein